MQLSNQTRPIQYSSTGKNIVRTSYADGKIDLTEQYNKAFAMIDRVTDLDVLRDTSKDLYMVDPNPMSKASERVIQVEYMAENDSYIIMAHKYTSKPISVPKYSLRTDTVHFTTDTFIYANEADAKDAQIANEYRYQLLTIANYGHNFDDFTYWLYSLAFEYHVEQDKKDMYLLSVTDDLNKLMQIHHPRLVDKFGLLDKTTFKK